MKLCILAIIISWVICLLGCNHASTTGTNLENKDKEEYYFGMFQIFFWLFGIFIPVGTVLYMIFRYIWGFFS